MPKKIDLKQKKRRTDPLLEWAKAAVFAAALACVMYLFFWPVSVNGYSMEDSFHSGDRLFISRLTRVAGLKRGDVVLCRLPGVKPPALKRIIALPGETVSISGGAVYINGEALAESYVKGGYTAGDISLALSADEYFVMGDNRDESSDSRDFGPVRAGDITSRVLFRWWKER